MPTPDPMTYYYKYAPSVHKLFLNGGVAILTSIIAGCFYGNYFAEIPLDLKKENVFAYRQIIGLGFGLVYLALPSILLIATRFFYQQLKAKKLAMRDYHNELMKSYKP
ncbi:hypothetical protein [Pseudomonas sp. NPDC087639]|uniref:hypothetical protein n=1 Tax=Pseudomonas sp. NPDC087639 TaxID=3364445 RepID=UPI00381F453F